VTGQAEQEGEREREVGRNRDIEFRGETIRARATFGGVAGRIGRVKKWRWAPRRAATRRDADSAARSGFIKLTMDRIPRERRAMDARVKTRPGGTASSRSPSRSRRPSGAPNEIFCRSIRHYQLSLDRAEYSSIPETGSIGPA